MSTTEVEPERYAIREVVPPDPCVAVIFGASGDLTRREILPALHELVRQNLLTEPIAIVGFALVDWSDDEFRRRMEEAVRAFGIFDAATWRRLSSRMIFVPGDFGDDPAGAYAALARRIKRLQTEHGIPDNVFFHLAAPPSFFATIAERLGESGLAHGRGWRRIVVEKPYGNDRVSAHQLDRRIRAVFGEEQIFRIDHFLGKETVQNVLVFRFGNPSFEPIWNRHHIDHVQITVAESIGVGTRGRFYEATGVVRDMLQNHLLQLLCMVAIEPPVEFNGPSLRDETAKVLQAAQVQVLREGRDFVFGQYGPGAIDGMPVPGYVQEPDIAPGSSTPTYVACRVTLDNWRWAGVPFYLRTGKRLSGKLSEIAIAFRPTPHRMFPLELPSSTLVFRLQPREGILQTFAAKEPGPELAVRPVRSCFLYAEAFGIEEPPPAYAWLLRDVMQGDQTLFARIDWIDRAWHVVEPILRAQDAGRHPGFPSYAAGDCGPASADALIAADGRRWRPI